MDISTITSTDGFKNFITFSLPGFIAVWPFTYLVIKYQNIDFATFQIIIFAAITILSLGVGLVIENIGNHLENYMAKSIPLKKTISKSEVTYYWRKYLMFNSIELLVSPVIFRYMSSLITSLKVELGLFISIIVMLCGQIWIELSPFPLFAGSYFLLYCIMFILLLLYLYWEAKDTIDVLHSCRKRIVDFAESKGNELIYSDNFVNESFTKYME